MMKNTIPSTRTDKAIAVIIVTVLIASFLLSLTSCSSIHKLFNKQKVRVDSTHVVVEKKDSSAVVDNISLHKDSSGTSDEITIDWGSVVRPDSTNPDDYLEITKEGIKTNVIPKSVTYKCKTNVFNYDSLANHSKIEVSQIKQDSTHLAKDEKSVNTKTDKTRFPVIPVTIAGLIIAAALFIFFWLRRRKKQIEKAAKLIIPPPGL